jgi:predicted metal-binding protein
MLIRSPDQYSGVVTGMHGLESELSKLASMAEKHGVSARQIASRDVVVSQWVRFKCRYGCKGYGKHLSCPPYAPAPAETRAMVDEYETGLLLRFDGVPGHDTFGPDDIPEDFHSFYRDLILWVNRTVHMLEKTAFYDGFYKAFGFGGYPCIYCDECVAEQRKGPVDESYRRRCRHMDLVRPSMEAAGMDVFATAKNAGWDLSTIPCRNLEYGKIIHNEIVSIGFVLIE